MYGAKSEGFAEDVVGGPLGDAEAEHAGKEVVLDDDDLAEDGVVGVVEVELLGVHVLAGSGDGLLPGARVAAVGGGLGVVARVAPLARADLAPLQRQLGLAHLLGHLAQAGLPRLREGLHALAAAPVLRVELLLHRVVGVPFNIASARAVLGVLAATGVVLDGAAVAAAGLAALVADGGASLAQWHHAHAGLPALLGVFAFAAAVLVSLPPVVLVVPLAPVPRTIRRRAPTAHPAMIIQRL